MKDTRVKCKTASIIITAAYCKLMKLSINNLEHSNEFNETINLIKRIIPIEYEQYKELSDEELYNWYQSINTEENRSQFQERINNKLNEVIAHQKAKHLNDGNLLSSVITGTVMIDVFKDLYNNIAALLFNQEITTEEFNMILNMYKIFRFNYLSVNNYVENICLTNNFDIQNTENLSLKDIEEKYQINFINNSDKLFVKYITEAIKELDYIEVNNKYLTAFYSMFEVSRINVMLKYVNKESLITISNVCHNKQLQNNNNPVLIKVRKIIEERKRELS